MIERQTNKYVTLRDLLSIIDKTKLQPIIHFIKDDKIIKTGNINDPTDDEFNMLIDTFDIFKNVMHIYVLYGEYNINNEDIDESDDEYYQFEEVD
jgi:hypothetical protein